MEAKDSKPTPTEEKVVDFSIKNFIKICLDKWIWFLLSLIVFVGLGIVYIIKAQPVYERYVDVLIKDQDMGGGGAASISSAFASMGLVASNTSVNNELITLTSPAIMYEVVNRLDLDMNYLQKKFPRSKTLYGSSLPFIVNFDDVDSESAAGFTIDINPDYSATLYNFYAYDEDAKKVKHDEEVKMAKGAHNVKTPVGRITITPNPECKEGITEPMKVVVTKSGLQATVESYSKKLKGDLVDQDAEVIDLSIKDVCPQRATDILSSVINIYNENWVEDKNRMAVATSSFIDERLKVIQQELGEVDTEIAAVKSETGIPDLTMQGSFDSQEKIRQEKEMLDKRNELSMAGFLKEYVNNPANVYNVIPASTGVGNDVLARQITDYNVLLLTRNNLVSNSSVNNPLVADYDHQLKGQREAIVKAINTNINQLKAALSNMEKAYGMTRQELSRNPVQAKRLLSSERQQMVKQELYLFLLQKREENELTQTFTAYNTRIITPPTGPLDPVSPKKKLIILACIFLGVGLPAMLVYIIENNTTTIRSRKDLENVTVPFSGEVPQVGGKAKFRKLVAGKKKKKELSERPLIVVENGNRDVVNEAFRVIRSNIEFMSGKDHGCDVVMLTSFNPGSGKSFISYNLCVAMALKGKKVLLIDGDLRHGSASTYVPQRNKGLTNILAGNVADWRSLLVNLPDYPTMQVLPIGKTPPNPAELLENGRIGELLNEARADYDFIIIDCPPVDIVVDTQIVEKYVDRTVFVVRAGLLQKSALPDIMEIYESKKYKNMSIILNGTDSAHSRYHTYGNYQSFND
ncbi:MAG: polysaccharide biosynthesis tyrosine autokinase [Bacteroidales bacterium]|nr:polysaccharide biosynthesis tyrosine autokinase [Bacteroidales bacterium]